MSRGKRVVMVLAMVLGSSPVWACDDGVAALAQTSSPFETQVVPAVLHLPGPGEEPLYTAIQFVKAPPILPGNRCEARCLADFRKCEADCSLLLDLCAADCTDGV